mmetsp:Transcript_22851/g.61971  ORF Transcript_22851/g.61971 Transcript_22851/m.61971 type:complete len:399 (-) Transcript_22851:654-1850(-)
MGREEETRARGAHVRADGVPHAALGRRVHARRGLVEADERGRADQRDGERELALVASGVKSGLPVGVAREPHVCHEALRARLRLRGRQPAQGADEAEVLYSREAANQRVVLRAHADVRARRALLRRDGPAGDKAVARGGRHLARDHLEGGGLSRPVDAEEAKDLSGVHGEAQPVHGRFRGRAVSARVDLAQAVEHNRQTPQARLVQRAPTPARGWPAGPGDVAAVRGRDVVELALSTGPGGAPVFCGPQASRPPHTGLGTWPCPQGRGAIIKVEHVRLRAGHEHVHAHGFLRHVFILLVLHGRRCASVEVGRGTGLVEAGASPARPARDGAHDSEGVGCHAWVHLRHEGEEGEDHRLGQEEGDGAAQRVPGEGARVVRPGEHAARARTGGGVAERGKH